MNSGSILVTVNLLLFLSAMIQFLSADFMEATKLHWLHELHEINGFILGFLLLAHLILNRSWIKNRFFSRK
jgi:hypothetical protein